MIAVGGMLSLAACARHDFPPVPPITPYQPSAFLEAAKAHGDGVVTMAIPENKPPYFNGSTNDGIERDAIRESFALVGKYVEFTETAGRQKKYDSERFGAECVSTVSPELKLKSKSYFSEPVVTYHYTPFTLKKNKIVITRFSDLDGKTVEAFSLGSKYLGTEFSSVIPRMLNYAEHENRSSQVALLLHDRVQVLVIDRTMFHFIRNALMNARPDAYDAEVAEVPLEINVEFRIACHNQDLVNQFNRGLVMLHASGRYGKIFDHYLGLDAQDAHPKAK